MAATIYPPGPRPRVPGAHLLAFRRQPLAFLCQVSHTYGDVASFRLGPERVVLVTHPDAMREVLVTQHRAFIKARRGDVSKQFLGEGLLNSEGDVHQRQRRLVQPAFARQRLAQYAPVITAHGVRLRQQWQAGDTLDIAQAMAHITLAIAGRTLFGPNPTSLLPGAISVERTRQKASSCKTIGNPLSFLGFQGLERASFSACRPFTCERDHPITLSFACSYALLPPVTRMLG